MAKSKIEVAFLSAEKVEFDNVKLVKLFVGDEPDMKRELGVSIISMQSHPDFLDEIWEACKGLDVLEEITVTAEIERGSKNMGKIIVHNVQPAKTVKSGAPSRQQVTASPIV
jgi:hypothetical protein